MKSMKLEYKVTKVCKKVILSNIITALLIFFMLCAFPFVATAETTKLYVDPPKSKVAIGENFTVNVVVANVTNLYGWEFKLYYNNAMLNGTSVSEGEFLKVQGDTFFGPINFTDTYNATHGILWATGSLLGNVSGVDDSGVIAEIGFKCKQFGNSSLLFDYSELGDPEGTEIQHVTEEGSVETWPRNIAILNVTPSTLEPYAGQIVSIAVVIRNEGNYTETFNLTTFCNDNSIETKTVVEMPLLSQITIMFEWDTVGLPTNINYTIKAEASVLLGETNVTDNVFVDGEVRLRHVTVNIIELTPCNQTGYPAEGFAKGSMAYFKVDVNNSDVDSKPVLVTVNVFDDESVPIGLASFQGQISQGSFSFILGFRLPTIASTGNATIYASVFTDWPHLGGVPYCTSRSEQFEITG